MPTMITEFSGFLSFATGVEHIGHDKLMFYTYTMCNYSNVCNISKLIEKKKKIVNCFKH